jgi:hypothetical protein
LRYLCGKPFGRKVGEDGPAKCEGAGTRKGKTGLQQPVLPRVPKVQTEHAGCGREDACDLEESEGREAAALVKPLPDEAERNGEEAIQGGGLQVL